MTIRSFDDLPEGERIVVRYRLPASGSDSGPKLSDALGTFTGLHQDGDGAGIATIETRSGPVQVPLADITHAKRVPPPPARRRPRP
ncbi:putative acetyltransferase [Zhihengliuella salsuginis]|uniref:Histone acetyltransferase Rv0428c-like SH3 domain-containing protein n=1 Tax=Zhihengliuella salsuginis TaxID=578222 RepID=A0ABQ3GGQ8_9MICC|nr:hypothetical protein [Zhihengliuella salsuginis]GHD03854.1 hypothetical protein GCM10008096_10440 [Zhihengliuella salsuginis]